MILKKKREKAFLFIIIENERSIQPSIRGFFRTTPVDSSCSSESSRLLPLILSSVLV